MTDKLQLYKSKLNKAMDLVDSSKLNIFIDILDKAWKNKSNIFVCGNGGSAGNANHIANDFIYGAGLKSGIGFKIESLAANTAVITCLANDIGYENIFAEQIRVKGNKGDILIALSGSGNSENIVRAINQANEMSLISLAILGFDGGKCKDIANKVIHVPIDDMQISEDIQMIIMNICMKWFSE